MRHGRIFLLLVTSLVVFDQGTKIAIRQSLPVDDAGWAASCTFDCRANPTHAEFHPERKTRHQHSVVPRMFNIVHTRNRGAAFGILAGHPYRMALFSVVTMLAFVFILGYYRRLREDEGLLAVALSCVFAGALGNFIDRLLYRQVTDFLQFYVPEDTSTGALLVDMFGSSRWPSFNVADSCICVGVALLLLNTAQEYRRLAASEPEAGP
ncbi:MAG: signal peptidase II [Deltaproteobacteria bacterium]|nr:signal peptidase II [Deltaproteobacteria bacterium]